MNEKNENIVVARLQDLVRLRKRISFGDEMFFAEIVDLASECGVDEFLEACSQELKSQLAEWLPLNIDELLFIPSMPPEKDKATRETMKLLRDRCSAIRH